MNFELVIGGIVGAIAILLTYQFFKRLNKQEYDDEIDELD